MGLLVQAVGGCGVAMIFFLFRHMEIVLVGDYDRSNNEFRHVLGAL